MCFDKFYYLVNIWLNCVRCCRAAGDEGGMRPSPHGAAPGAPAGEVRYPFGVQNDLGQVILASRQKVSYVHYVSSKLTEHLLFQTVSIRNK